MRRLVLALAAAAFAAPALAQTTDAGIKAFFTRYTQTFNKGDAAALAKDFFAVPDVPQATMEANLTAKFAELRKDEFGKMEIYGLKSCSSGPDSAKAEVDYAFNYTYGGVMPPGDQATIFDLSRTANGWRIVKIVDMQPGMKLSCAQ